MKTDILGIHFDDLTREEAAQAGAGLLRSGSFHYVVTPNPEFILASEKDPEFRRILNEADLVLPDGHRRGLFRQNFGHTFEGAGTRHRLCR